ncbi:transcript variant X2 [Nothobranchius furzeri]|uniref:Transcript variant X2 n=1 Tax=Nothobranchius furzeri TaxID=105023 RepID=A0A9D3BSZ1_NOTFU|nr:transcript variant X2 [Nothobranchius furzeri]
MDTRVCCSEADSAHGRHIVIQLQGEDLKYAVTSHNTEETKRWSKALQQHIYNLSQWKQCCDNVMKISTRNTKKPNTVKQGSLFHEMVTPSSPRKGPVIPDLSAEIRTLLLSYYKERY